MFRTHPIPNLFAFYSPPFVITPKINFNKYMYMREKKKIGKSPQRKHFMQFTQSDILCFLIFYSHQKFSCIEHYYERNCCGAYPIGTVLMD